MDTVSLQVQMLGGLTIRYGDQEINDKDNRSKKVWLLLAYMIYSRNRSVTQEELVQLLWGDSENSSNPVNAMKTMFHRVRTSLDRLGDMLGHTLIIRSGGSYAWNPAYSFVFDVDEFEKYCKAGDRAQSEEEQLEAYQNALTLYQGDFLPKLSSEPWVVPVTAYYHSLYMQTVRTTLSLLEGRGRMDEAISLSRRATEIEPYDEGLYVHLMRNLLQAGNHQDVIKVYENMSNLLFSNFGIMPSDETTALYREAVRSINDREVNLGIVKEQLKEGENLPGALFCDYDFFKIIYQAESRAVARSGDAVQIGLVSVSGTKGELAKRSLDVCMENLRSLICCNLRKGDVASRCSVSQYIILLPQANYENACMVMDRISKSFARQYPHSPAVLRFSVQPLEPNP